MGFNSCPQRARTDLLNRLAAFMSARVLPSALSYREVHDLGLRARLSGQPKPTWTARSPKGPDLTPTRTYQVQGAPCQ